MFSLEELPYKTEAMRKGLQKVMDDVIRIAVKLVSHPRTQILKLWDRNPWLGCLRKLYELCSAL